MAKDAPNAKADKAKADEQAAKAAEKEAEKARKEAARAQQQAAKAAEKQAEKARAQQQAAKPAEGKQGERRTARGTNEWFRLTRRASSESWRARCASETEAEELGAHHRGQDGDADVVVDHLVDRQ